MCVCVCTIASNFNTNKLRLLQYYCNDLLLYNKLSVTPSTNKGIGELLSSTILVLSICVS